MWKSLQRKTFINYVVTNNSDIHDKIIPFFNLYPIRGIKQRDYINWCKVAELIKNKSHLTLQGLNEIKNIRTILNKK